MKADNSKPKDIDEYIAGFPADVQKVLKKIRATIRKAAPKADEKISYRMPAFVQNGVLIYFAAFKHHIGIYPPVTDNTKLKREAAIYAGPKGNLQLPLDKPIPHDLIRRIVEFRLKKNVAKISKSPKREHLHIDHSFLKMSSTNSAMAALASFSASFADSSKVKR